MKTAEDIIKEKTRGMICTDPNSSVTEVVRLMVQKKIGAVLIKENEKIVGIYTERDYVQDSVKEGFNPKKSVIKDHMNTDLVTIPFHSTIPKIQDVILGKCVRHVLVEKEGAYIGLLSTGDVTRADLNEKTERLASVSWDYYEDWQWKKNKKS